MKLQIDANMARYDIIQIIKTSNHFNFQICGLFFSLSFYSIILSTTIILIIGGFQESSAQRAQRPKVTMNSSVSQNIHNF